MFHNKRRKDIVFGRRPVIELFESGKPVDKVYLARGTAGDFAADLKTLIKSHRVPMQLVPREALNRMTGGNHQGVIAVTAEIPYQQLEQVLPFIYERGDVPFFLVLDGITDVRNFGAIARTAVASGVNALVVGMRDAAPVNAEAMRASAGALHHLAVCRENSVSAALELLAMNGIPALGLAGDGDVLPWDVNLKEPVALVMGSEERGIQPKVNDLLDSTIRLPMAGEIDSYNVSVAAGMICYEVQKQRR